MASFTLVTSLPKFGPAGAAIARARPWNNRVFAAATPRPIQVPKSPNEDLSPADSMKQGANETINNSMMNESMQDKAYSTAEHAIDKTKNAANQAARATQNIAEKTKQTMQEAWDSTKHKASQAADTVMGKSQQSADYVKQNAETAKRNMNKRN